MLEVSDLVVAYGAIRALKGVSLAVRQGEIVSLVGANGAGKTTLLKAISGLLKPVSGQITFEGGRVEGKRPNDIVALGVSHVPEGRRVFSSLSVADNLLLGAFLRKSQLETHEAYERVFHLFPRLRERLGQRAGTLSGGEQQMLALGRALMAGPKVLLMDEPSLGLAPNLVDNVFDAIGEIRKLGVTILLVEQNAYMALSTADRAYVMETGTITYHDTASALLHDDKIRAAYLGEETSDISRRREGPTNPEGPPWRTF